MNFVLYQSFTTKGIDHPWTMLTGPLMQRLLLSLNKEGQLNRKLLFNTFHPNPNIESLEITKGTVRDWIFDKDIVDLLNGFENLRELKLHQCKKIQRPVFKSETLLSLEITEFEDKGRTKVVGNTRIQI